MRNGVRKLRRVHGLCRSQEGDEEVSDSECSLLPRSIDKAKRSKELQKLITDSFNYAHIDTYTVSGKIPTTKRNDIVREFAKSEGAPSPMPGANRRVDVPHIDCIVFADPRSNKVDIVQALGRALRKEGKDWGYGAPCHHDEETGEVTMTTSRKSSRWCEVASNDERIIDDLKDQQEDVAIKKGRNQFELQVIREFVGGQIEEALRIKLWDRPSHMTGYHSQRLVSLSVVGASPRLTGVFTESLASDLLISRQLRILSTIQVVGLAGGTGWAPTTGTTRNRKYRDFEGAREFVRLLGLKNYTEWYLWQQDNRPNDIPSNPRGYYQDKG